MPTFTVGTTVAAGAGAAAAYVTLNTGASRRAFIREMGMFNGSATSSSVGIGTPGNTPTATSPITPVAQDLADATATAALASTWSAAPTAPTVYQRQTVLGAAVGAGVVWKLALDETIVLAKSAWEVWWNFGAATSATNWAVYVEYIE